MGISITLDQISRSNVVLEKMRYLTLLNLVTKNLMEGTSHTNGQDTKSFQQGIIGQQYFRMPRSL